MIKAWLAAAVLAVLVLLAAYWLIGVPAEPCACPIPVDSTGWLLESTVGFYVQDLVATA